MGFRDTLMKVIIKVHDVVELAKRFEASPAQAMRELTTQVKEGVKDTLERLLEAEIELFLGQEAQGENKRNGYSVRTFALKGVGAVQLRVPRDRLGRFDSKIVPAGRRYDEALEKDLALLHLAGLSTRMLSHISRRVLGLDVSAQEVSNALKTIVPQAKAFLERPLAGRAFKYLYVDGTNFRVRRTTVDREPTLVVIGVDEHEKKSVLAMVQGDKDSRAAWELVFTMLKERGLDASKVELGLMDGLPGLGEAFLEAFPQARIARCWVHKLRNVMPLVPRRYQAEFKSDWDKMAYASGREAAQLAFTAFEERWEKICGDAVARFVKDIDALFCHYDFPPTHWASLRTTNPIERVNKEFKRRSKSMEQMGPDGLKALLAFTALRLEFGWSTTPISSPKLANLNLSRTKRGHQAAAQLDEISRTLLN
jgi:putative transposase